MQGVGFRFGIQGVSVFRVQAIVSDFECWG